MTDRQRPALEGVEVIATLHSTDTRGSSLAIPLSAHLLAGAENTSLLASLNEESGTVRGLHYQSSESPQAKFVWCTRGSAFDVLVDLRRQSSTFGCWMSLRLSPAAGKALWVPPMVAHGYQTLEPHTHINYLLVGARDLEQERTLLWSDEDLAIPWPLKATRISEKDRVGTSWNTIEYY